MSTSASLSVNKTNGFTTHQSRTPVHGFTLIELLITISIIAILSVIGMVVYTSVMKQGRDSKRQADLRSIQSALEQYNSDQGYYPLNLPLLSTKYINTVPTGTPAYNYIASASKTSFGACDNSSTKCIGYCLMAKFDIPPSLSCPSGYTVGANNFFVTPP